MIGKGEAPYQGRVGLTSRSSVHVTSDAGGTFATTIYTSVNVTKNPELKAKLADGTLNTVTCPLTQQDYSLAVPVVFHDENARVFGLLLPDALRHQEYEHRRQVLKSIEADSEDAPLYVRNFPTAFSLDGLTAASTAPVAAKPVLPSVQPPKDLEASKELARARAALEEEQKKLKTERAQLDDIRLRFDREREQLDGAQAQLAGEREKLNAGQGDLESARQKVAADRLNLEQKKLQANSVGDSPPEERTQVVTDDQFIEVVGDEDLVIDDSDIADSAPDHNEITPLTSGVPKKFSGVATGKVDTAVKILDGVVVAAAKMERSKIESLFASDPDVLVQFHMLDNYPVIGLALASYDEDGHPQETVGWALDFSDDAHRVILDQLQKHFMVRFGLYDAKGTLLRAVECEAPLTDNLEWIRAHAVTKYDAAKPKGAFSKARKTYLAADFERVGSMRHNFEQDSFSDLVSPSDVKLVAGIVGFWSTPEKLEYLLGNRCFPYVHFRGIQERVARAATTFGVCVNEPLRDVAIELGLATDEIELVALLTANFAEVCISIRANDLDPGDQWDNWDALLGLGEELGIPPDSDVVELAEISLKRAQEMAELEELDDVAVPESSKAAPVDVVEVDRTLIVSKRSESTGVTYFLPQDAVLDSFDNLADMARPDLELLLKDPTGRLEASQMLLDRFGASAVAAVMACSEEMNAPEVAALAKFVETKANGLEGELVRTVESGGPSATFVSAHGLTSMRSTTAIPSLIDALQDPKRNGNSERMVLTLSAYGDKLLPALTRVLKRSKGNDRPLIDLLAQIEDHSEGTLNKLSKDRSKKLREAARKARELRD